MLSVLATGFAALMLSVLLVVEPAIGIGFILRDEWLLGGLLIVMGPLVAPHVRFVGRQALAQADGALPACPTRPRQSEANRADT